MKDSRFVDLKKEFISFFGWLDLFQLFYISYRHPSLLLVLIYPMLQLKIRLEQVDLNGVV